jgi:hypothetical protein
MSDRKRKLEALAAGRRGGKEDEENRPTSKKQAVEDA